MPELGCAYDTSFPDTDPFEPLPGGCCSIFPFFIDGIVELPITLVQDHTLFEILGHHSISAWVLKSKWIIHHHGLINLIVHPDYMRTPERLELYESFLLFLNEQQGGWHALPREVAQWWKTRSAFDVDTVASGGGETNEGVLASRPTLGYAREVAGGIGFDLAPPRARRRRFVSGAEPASQPSSPEPRLPGR